MSLFHFHFLIVQTTTPQTIMGKYYVTYTSSIDHDCCTVWTEANSKQEAIDDVRSEYWDIEEIIDCYPA